jgi:hypothetical protein
MVGSRRPRSVGTQLWEWEWETKIILFGSGENRKVEHEDGLEFQGKGNYRVHREGVIKSLR